MERDENVITIDEVKQIAHELFLENLSVSEDDFIEDTSCIIYRNDVLECGGNTIHSKHIDIEFSYGECCEIPQTAPAFQFICKLCKFTPSEKEFTIYQA